MQTSISRRHLLRLALVPASAALVPGAVSAGTEQIAFEGFIPAGGIDQWVAIRGRDRTRTPLLFLHGGPGEAQSPFLPIFAPWEERFVVAQWDQRGTGRTFGRHGVDTPNMSLDQMARDVVDVAEYVLDQLDARQLVLVGHSWGTILGLSAVGLRPELFSAFVGSGQVASGAGIFEEIRSSAIARATTAGDDEAVAALTALNLRNPDLTDMRELAVLFRWDPGFPPVDLAFLRSRGALLGFPDDPASDAAADFFASNPDPRNPEARPFSLLRLWPDIHAFDALSIAKNLPIPFFVIHGREDTRTPPAAARALVDAVTAPAKRFTLIDGGHFACFSNPTGFLDTLDGDLRSVGIG